MSAMHAVKSPGRCAAAPFDKAANSSRGFAATRLDKGAA